jgi:tetratricopeptide (TPR) repeat protein
MGLRILVVKTQAEARAAVAAFNAGTPFDRLARERSIGPERERGGYLGRVDPGTMWPEARRALAKARRGRLTPIFPAENGFAVIQVLTEREEEEMETQRRRAPEAQALLERGTELGQAGELDEAVSLFQQTIELNPELAEAHFNLAMAYRELKQMDAAITAMRRLVRLRPDDFEAQMLLGTWLFERDAFLDASQAFERAATLEMDSREAWLRLAQSYDAAARPQAAVGAYRQVLNLLGRDDPAIYGALFRVAMQAKNGPVAVASARKLRELRTGHEGYLDLGNALLLNGEAEAAVLEFQKAVALAPSSASAYARLASAQARAGQAESAAESLLQAIQLEPEDPDYYRSLARLYEGMERLDLAIVALRDGVSAAAASSPQLQAELAEGLAGLYERAGMLREAHREWDRARSLRTP